MSARFYTKPANRRRWHRIVKLELMEQPTPTKQHEDKDLQGGSWPSVLRPEGAGELTPPSSPGELAQRPASRAVRPYRPRGTCGTFAGRRPPKDAEKLRKFEEDRAKYLEKLSDKCGKRRSTTMMQSYRDFVQEMMPLETEGSGPERLRSVAAKWKQRATKQDQLAQENKMVL